MELIRERALCVVLSRESARARSSANTAERTAMFGSYHQPWLLDFLSGSKEKRAEAEHHKSMDRGRYISVCRVNIHEQTAHDDIPMLRGRTFNTACRMVEVAI